jgi:hypothetical protein
VQSQVVFPPAAQAILAQLVPAQAVVGESSVVTAGPRDLSGKAGAPVFSTGAAFPALLIPKQFLHLPQRDVVLSATESQRSAQKIPLEMTQFGPGQSQGGLFGSGLPFS